MILCSKQTLASCENFEAAFDVKTGNKATHDKRVPKLPIAVISGDHLGLGIQLVALHYASRVHEPRGDVKHIIEQLVRVRGRGDAA